MARCRIATIKPGVPAPGMADRLGETIDERRGVDYHVLRAKGALSRVTEPGLLFGWSVNPYRGCELGCHYCYARYTHGFLGLAEPEAFERRIYVKQLDARRLAAELARARRSGQLVALGTATDPYQPAEAVFRVTRAVLEAAARLPGLRLSITTKAALVERDLELLVTMSERSEVGVNFSITTVCASLARQLEPRAPRPDLRFAAMAKLARAGLMTRLFAMPVLPELTDDEENLRALVAAARQAGAAGVVWNALHLRPGTRDTFFAFLAAEFPALVPTYRRLYARSAYVPRAWAAALDARMGRLTRAAGLGGGARGSAGDGRRRDAPTGEQLSLVW